MREVDLSARIREIEANVEIRKNSYYLMKVDIDRQNYIQHYDGPGGGGDQDCACPRPAILSINSGNGFISLTI